MSEKVEIKTKRIEFVGNDGDDEVWEIVMNPIKSKQLKDWGRRKDRRVLGIPLENIEMPYVKIIFEKMEGIE